MPRNVILRIVLIVSAACIPIVLLPITLSRPEIPLFLKPWLIAAVSLWILCAGVIAFLIIPQIDRWLWTTARHHAGEKIAALTFDDGPDEPWTPKVLDILRTHGIKATFFVTGEKARKHPALLHQMAAEGHEIGNHTDSHRTLIGRPWAEVEEDIAAANTAIARALGHHPRFFRSPHGFRIFSLKRRLARMNLTLIPWTRGIWDTDGADAEELFRRFSKRIPAFDILLLHDGVDPKSPSPSREDTIRVLPRIIAEYRQQQYRFATIGEI